MSDPTILLVDDNPKLRELYRMSLETLSHMRVIGEASDGQAGIDAVRSLRPDVVLLDLSMPTMDGLEALGRMREANPGSRVVVLTGFRREKLEDLASSLGASGFLEKGLTPRRLVDEVQRIASQPALAYHPISSDTREALQQRLHDLL